MPEIMPDLSEVESSNLDPRVYPAKIATATPGVAKSGGAKIDVEFDIDVGDGKTRKRKTSVPTAGKGAFRFTQLLRATGFGDIATRLEKGERVPFNTDNLIDQNLQVEIGPGQEKDGGGFWDEVKQFIKA